MNVGSEISLALQNLFDERQFSKLLNPFFRIFAIAKELLFLAQMNTTPCVPQPNIEKTPRGIECIQFMESNSNSNSRKYQFRINKLDRRSTSYFKLHVHFFTLLQATAAHRTNLWILNSIWRNVSQIMPFRAESTLSLSSSRSHLLPRSLCLQADLVLSLPEWLKTKQRQAEIQISHKLLMHLLPPKMKLKEWHPVFPSTYSIIFVTSPTTNTLNRILETCALRTSIKLCGECSIKFSCKNEMGKYVAQMPKEATLQLTRSPVDFRNVVSSMMNCEQPPL